MFVLYSRRSVSESFTFVQSLRTAFVEENFGDFNEKAYMDGTLSVPKLEPLAESGAKLGLQLTRLGPTPHSVQSPPTESSMTGRRCARRRRAPFTRIDARL